MSDTHVLHFPILQAPATARGVHNHGSDPEEDPRPRRCLLGASFPRGEARRGSGVALGFLEADRPVPGGLETTACCRVQQQGAVTRCCLGHLKPWPGQAEAGGVGAYLLCQP